MARYFKTLLLAAACVMASCQEGREAGDLLGQWRLDGSSTEYMCISGEIVQFRSQVSGSSWAKFQHRGDSLFIQCYSYGQRSDTVTVEERFGMKPYADIRMKIERLDGERLELSKGSQRWGFDLY